MSKDEAIKVFGSVRKLAEALDITEQAVHQWGVEVPELRFYQIRNIIENDKQ